MNIWQRFRVCSPGIAGVLALSEGGFLLPASAQLIPDQTLGAESSFVTPNVEVRGDVADRIDGGATRGANLFHSFDTFGVEFDQRVYFSNPTDIENILTRVTGDSRSDIYGTLGVDGGADLYLLNPNGIVFGPDAQLDVAGSLTASTADRVTFSDGTSFSATNPNAPPLVTVNIPMGVQFGGDTPADLVSEANLEVGENLNLSGGSVVSRGTISAKEGNLHIEGITGDVQVQNIETHSAMLSANEDLVLEESQLRTDTDLSLLAKNSVRIRDTEENAFLAAAGGDLVVQGNNQIDILALNHPTVPLQAGQNLVIASDGLISADTHFFSGGNFSIQTLTGEPGTFASLYDPIISSLGNVSFGDYTGTALKVETIGNINATGDITITGPDTALSVGVPSEGNISVDVDNGEVDNVTLSTLSAATIETLEDFLNIPLFTTPNGDAQEGSAIKTEFELNVGESAEITFEWEFSTDESGFFNDFAFVSLSEPSNVLVENEDLEFSIIDGPEGFSLSNPFTLTNSGTSSPRSGEFDLTFSIVEIPSEMTDMDDDDSMGAETFSPVNFIFGIGVVDVFDTLVTSELDISNAVRIIDGESENLVQATDPDVPILRSEPALILRAGVELEAINSALDSQLLASPNDNTVVSINVDTTTFTAPGLPSSMLPQLPTEIGFTPSSDPGIRITGDISTSPEVGSSGRIIFSSLGDIILQGGINTSSELENGGTVDFISSQGSVLLLGTGSTDLNTSSMFRRGGDICIAASACPDIRSETEIEILTPVQLVYIKGIDINTSTDGVGGSGNVDISSHNIFIENSSIIADIGEVPIVGLDTEIFLFQVTEAADDDSDSLLTLLSLNDDSDFVDPGSFPIFQFSTFTFDSYLEYDFQDEGTYILGVGSFPSNTDSTILLNMPVPILEQPIIGTPLPIGAYTLNVAIENLLDTSDSSRPILEDEDNDTLSEAQEINSEDFSINNGNPNIPVLDGPSVSISGVGDNETFDYFQFEIPENSRGIFDIDTESEGGNAGIVRLTATNDITVNDSTISSSTEGIGNSGSISVDAGNVVSILDNSDVRTSVLNNSDGGEGRGGNITINSAELNIHNSDLRTDTAGTIDPRFPNSASGGNISLTSQKISLTDAQIQAGTTGEGNSGNITITNTNFDDDDETIELSALNSSVRANSTGAGNAGNIEIVTSDVTLSNVLISTSNSHEETNALSEVEAFGNIQLQNINTLSANNSLITASTAGGVAGNITLNEDTSQPRAARVTLDNTFTLETGDERGGIVASATAGGDAGSVVINTDTLEVKNGAEIAVSSDNGSGIAGSIQISADTVDLMNGDITATTDAGGDEAGDVPSSISLEGLARLTATAGSDISTSTNSGAAGNVLIDADTVSDRESTVELTDSTVIAEATEAGGQAGNVTIRTTDLSATRSRIATENVDDVNADSDDDGQFDRGNIVLDDLETLTATNSLISTSTAGGVAGNITVNEGIGQSRAARVTLDNTFMPDIEDDRGGIVASATDGGDAGSIVVNADTLEVTNGAEIAVSSDNGSGTAGSIRISADTVDLMNGDITATTDAGGDEAGDVPSNISLEGLSRLTATNGSDISTSTTSGAAGNVLIDADTLSDEESTVELTDSTVIAEATEAGGQAGNVTIRTTDLSATRSRIATENVDDVNADSDDDGQFDRGNIVLDGLETLTATNSLISTSTEQGVAGNITVNEDTSQPRAARVTLDNTFTLETGDERGGIVASATAGGDAGSVVINTDTLEVKNGAEIAVSSDNGSGIAGSIQISADTVDLMNGDITATTDTGGDESGNIPSSIRLEGLSRLTATAGSDISTSTTSGEAGNVLIDADTALDYIPLVQLTDSTVIAEATSEGGQAGNVTIRTSDLSATRSRIVTENVDDVNADSDDDGQFDRGNIVLDSLETLTATNSLISTSTEQGVAGNITVNEGVGQNRAARVTLDNTFTPDIGDVRGGIVASATDGGDAGSVVVNADTLEVKNGAEIAVSSDNGDGTAGSIQISADTVELTDGDITATTDAGGDEAGDVPSSISLEGLSRLTATNGSDISTSTNSGAAGNVLIDADTVSDTEPTVELTDSTVEAEATEAGGRAGNVTIQTSDLSATRSDIKVSSSSSQAGDLTINAFNIFLDSSQLLANVGNSDRNEADSLDTNANDSSANINLTVGQLLLMRNESLISARALGDANGGNVNINMSTETLFPIGLISGPVGNDIIATAENGDGGQITIDATALIGFLERPAIDENGIPIENHTNDIDASSGRGNDGTVRVNTIGTDITQDLGGLAITFIDASGQIVAQCSFGETNGGSAINVTGRGGLPTDPTALLPASLDDSDWISLDPQPDIETAVTWADGIQATQAERKAAEVCVQAWQASQQSVHE